MENQRQKWVNLSFVFAGGLLAYVFYSLGYRIVGVYDLEARLANVDLFLRAGCFLLGAGLFFFLYWHDQANQFMNEVVVELSRVTWPTQDETAKATIVVINILFILLVLCVSASVKKCTS